MSRFRLRPRSDGGPRARHARRPRAVRPACDPLEPRRLLDGNPNPYYHGGRLLRDVQVESVFYGQGWLNTGSAQIPSFTLVPTSQDQRESDLNSFVDYLVTSPYMDMLQKLNTSPPAPPPPNSLSDSFFSLFFDPAKIPAASTAIGHGHAGPPRELTGASSPTMTATVTDAQIQADLRAAIAARTLVAPDSGAHTHDMLYLVFVGPKTKVTKTEPDGTTSTLFKDFGGYHGTFQTADGKTAFYAVVGYYPNLDDQTSAASHEIAEAVTNPDLWNGYHTDLRTDNHGVRSYWEVGDMADWTLTSDGKEHDVRLGPGNWAVEEVGDRSGNLLAPAGSKPYTPSSTPLDLTDAGGTSVTPPPPPPPQSLITRAPDGSILSEVDYSTQNDGSIRGTFTAKADPSRPVPDGHATKAATDGTLLMSYSYYDQGQGRIIGSFTLTAAGVAAGYQVPNHFSFGADYVPPSPPDDSAPVNLDFTATPSWTQRNISDVFRTVVLGSDFAGNPTVFATDFAKGVDIRQPAESGGPGDNWAPLDKVALAMSAGTDPAGQPELVVIDVNHEVWYRDQKSDGSWADWANLGGYAKSIATITDAQGFTQVFAVGSDNAVWHSDRQEDGSWSGWASLGGYATSLSATIAQGATQVFAIGGDGAVYARSDGGDGRWFTGWVRLGGYASAIAADTDQNDLPEVFAIGGDGAVYDRTSNNDGSWRGWVDLGGYAREIRTTYDRAGDTEVLAIGGDYAVYARLADSGGTWRGWVDLGGSVQSIDVIDNADGVPEVFAIGGDGSVSSKRANDDGSWTDWSDAGLRAKAVTTAVEPDGRSVAFAIGASGAVWVRSQDDYGDWGPWQSLGGFARAIAATTDANGNMVLLAIGGDGAVYARSEGADGAWRTGWADLGGYSQAIAATTDADGRMVLFAIGSDGSVFARAGGAHGDWKTPWVNLGGFAKAISAVIDAAGRPTVAAIGGDDAVYVGSVTADGTWDRPWIALGGRARAIDAATDINGRMSIFVIGTDNAVWYNGEDLFGTWSHWQSLGGNVKAIRATLNDQGRFQVLATGTDDALYSRAQTNTDGTWGTGWKSLGGGGTTFAQTIGLDGTELFFVGMDGIVRHRGQDRVSS